MKRKFIIGLGVVITVCAAFNINLSSKNNKLTVSLATVEALAQEGALKTGTPADISKECPEYSYDQSTGGIKVTYVTKYGTACPGSTPSGCNPTTPC